MQLPADAKLFFDGEATTQVSDDRFFITPPLQFGKNYRYEVRAVVKRDGEELTETKQIRVRSGETTTVTFGDMATARLQKLLEDLEPFPTIQPVSLIPATPAKLSKDAKKMSLEASPDLPRK